MEKVIGLLTPEERDSKINGYANWPKVAERFVTPAFDAEIARTDSQVERFLAQKGDVLIWHGRLAHRGSMARNPGMERRSLITHYSGISHRPDMTNRAQDSNGERYALFDHPLT